MRALQIAPEPFFSPRGTPFSVYYRCLVQTELGVEVDVLTYGQGDDPDLPGSEDPTITPVVSGSGTGYSYQLELGFAEGCSTTFAPLACGACDGKVTELTLEYQGSLSDALITVTQKKGNQTLTAFEGTVQPGEAFSFVGQDRHGTLGPEIKILVNGELNAEMHTSCSQPIGPGLVSGDFMVVEGASRNGGALCPAEEMSCGACDGKVTHLTLEYQGSLSDALITVTQKEGNRTLTAFEGTVQPGEQLSFIGQDKHGTLGPEIKILVNGELDAELHTSCSQPIGPGVTAGDFMVVEGASRNGGALCAVEPGCAVSGAPYLVFDGTSASWQLTNLGSEAVTVDWLTATWPVENGELIGLGLAGTCIYSGIHPPPTTTIGSGWSGSAEDRMIQPGDTIELLLDFANQAQPGRFLDGSR
jgi:hypothetical protein